MSAKTLLVVGLAICVIAALLMVTEVLSVGWGVVVGMIGLGLLSASGAKRTGASSNA